MEFIANSHCNGCGTKYENDAWPRACKACGNMVWRNPTPVSVALVRCGNGILGVRRGIEPKKGQLALPGGFHNYGETWQKALVREVDEETGVVIPIAEVSLFDAMTDPQGRHHLTFGTVETVLDALPTLVPNEETEELVILTGDETLCFPLHDAAFHAYMAQLRSERVRIRVDSAE